MGILSWDAYKTLDNTLRTFKRSGVLSLVSPRLFFQEISERDKEVAKRYSIPYTGDKKNLGIRDAFIRMVNETNTPYFLFAEQDFGIHHSKKEVASRLQDAVELLENHGVDVVKLRDRKNPGEPLYSRKFSDRKLRSFVLEALHFTEDPEKKYASILHTIPLRNRWYKTYYTYSTWSNNNFIAKTEWLRKEVLPVLEASKRDKSMTQDFLMERTLIDELKGYTVAAGPGLFTHRRVDRGE